MTNNPLLNQGPLPRFSAIIPELHIEAALDAVLAENRQTLTSLLAQNQAYTWTNLMQPLEEMGDKLNQMWSPVGHLHGVMESESLRVAYNACLPKLTEYHTEIMQDEHLFNAVESLAQSPEFTKLSAEQQKVINNELRDFKLAGVNLSPEKKARFADLQKELSLAQTRYAENLLDATNSWALHVTDEKEIAGLPDAAKALAAQTAEEHKKPGWILTLDHPCYIAIMKFVNSRETRRKIYTAFVTRASDQGPEAGKHDNSQHMDDILRIRHELANLVGFANFAEYSLATKMADTPKRVLDFLNDLVDKSKAAAAEEVADLEAYAASLGHEGTLESWDLTYYSEKLRQNKYDISQEDLKPYFPAPQVLKGMFDVVHKLYGITIQEKMGIDVWHPQVQFFEIFDSNEKYIGAFYTDLYARPHKRDGAWMDECRVRRIHADGSIQFPVAFLTCNFTRPLGDQPALLNQEEVETVFHEFGHCLHHLLTKINYAAVSGINGVAWDAVEFPSQMMEHWCWDKEAIALISKHVETGAVLPDALFKKMLAAKNFQSGLQMLRQLEFALFDFHLHLDYEPNLGGRVQATLDTVRKQVGVLQPPPFNRFQHSFSHIFAGSYAAGYYSYKWAEVLSSDAFSKFEETGVFNHTTGIAYLENILQVGGSRDPMVSFVAFRGREPRIDALLRHSGLKVEANS